MRARRTSGPSPRSVTDATRRTTSSPYEFRSAWTRSRISSSPPEETEGLGVRVLATSSHGARPMPSPYPEKSSVSCGVTDEAQRHAEEHGGFVPRATESQKRRKVSPSNAIGG